MSKVYYGFLDEYDFFNDVDVEVRFDSFEEHYLPLFSEDEDYDDVLWYKLTLGNNGLDGIMSDYINGDTKSIEKLSRNIM